MVVNEKKWAVFSKHRALSYGCEPADPILSHRAYNGALKWFCLEGSMDSHPKLQGLVEVLETQTQADVSHLGGLCSGNALIGSYRL